MAEYIEREAAVEALDVAERFLRSIPAADVVPVVHGEWVMAAAYNDGVINTAYCSVCRTFLPVCHWDYHNFCPTCGAKMDGERKGDDDR